MHTRRHNKRDCQPNHNEGYSGEEEEDPPGWPFAQLLGHHYRERQESRNTLKMRQCLRVWRKVKD